MSDSAFITVPLVPPSANNYCRHTRSGRHYLTPAAIAFKDAVAVCAKGQQVRGKKYGLNVTVYFGKGGKGDGDNLWKCIADGLVGAGVIHSDAAVKKWYLNVDRDWDDPRTEIWVTVL